MEGRGGRCTTDQVRCLWPSGLGVLLHILALAEKAHSRTGLKTLSSQSNEPHHRYLPHVKEAFSFVLPLRNYLLGFQARLRQPTKLTRLDSRRTVGLRNSGLD